MKLKILMLSLLGLIFFNSCSSDSNSSNSTSQNLDPNTILPKKIIEENGYQALSSSYDFYYNQNKLEHIHCSFFSSSLTQYDVDFNFTYNGNLISEINIFNNSGQVFSKTEFTYLNNKLVNKKRTDYISGLADEITESTYTYNSSNNIITRTLTHTINGNPDTATDTFTITNNLISKNNLNTTYSFTSSPYKNIIGIKDAFIENGLERNASFYVGNLLDNLFFSTTKNILRVYGASSYPILFYTYNYNDINFPISAVPSSGNGGPDDTNYQIFYQ